MAKIEDIEGIGDKTSAKLKVLGISSCEALLARGGSPAGREDIARQPESAGRLFCAVNHADLFRINGVGNQFAELLEASGVDSVIELGRRNPENLCSALAATNEQKKLCRTVPNLARVTEWINEAKTLPRAVA